LKVTRTAALVAMAACLALPAAAQAKTKTMLMGPPPATAKTLGEQTWANAYFPSTLTINAGDSVKFTAAGFHTVNIPPRGKADLLPIFAPAGEKVANATDAAGAAFWFNGQDNLGFNPELVASNFGKKITYTGAKRVESGLPLAPNPKPMTVKFTKAGSHGQGPRQGRQGADGLPGPRRAQEAGRRRDQDRQAARERRAAAVHRLPRRRRQGRHGVPRHGAGHAERARRLDREVPDVQGQL
jgi:plastocyanin